MASGETKHTLQPLVVNAAIAVAKGVAAVFTGSGAMLVAAKLRFKAGLAALAVAEVINAVERALREKAPEARWCFIEPDVEA